jgi:flagellar motor switch protein FliM
MAEQDRPLAENTIARIIEVASQSYERLPVLEVIFERFSLLLAPALKAHTGVITSVSVERFDYMTCDSALADMPTPSFVVVASVSPGDGKFGMVIDPELLFANLQIMLGGRDAQYQSWQPRGFTMIEKRIGQQLCEVVIRELKSAFRQIGDIGFRLEGLESSPKGAMIAPPESACIRVQLRIAFEGQNGKITFVLPNTSLDKMRPLLSQKFLGSQIGGEDTWRDMLQESVREANMTLSTVVGGIETNLAELLQWKPGTIIPLDVLIGEEARVVCGNEVIFKGVVGCRRKNGLAVRVTQDLRKTTKKVS